MDIKSMKTAPRDGSLFLAYKNDDGLDMGPHDYFVCMWKDFHPHSGAGKSYILGDGPRGQFYYHYPSMHDNTMHSVKPDGWIMKITKP